MPLAVVPVSPGTGRNILTRAITVAGEDADIQQIQLQLSGESGADQPLGFGQAVMASSLPVTVASDQPALPFSGTITGGTVDVSSLPPIDVATMPPVAITGVVTVAATDLDIRNLVSATDSVTAMQGGAPWTVAQSGTWTVIVDPATTAIVRQKPAATPSQASVAASASNVQLLAANANRLGATVYNDSTVALYLRLGTPASTTDFTVKMAADSYYEVPFNYTGVITGIWVSATGNARVTELTA